MTTSALGDLGRELVGAARGRRRGARPPAGSGVKRAASAAQLPTTAGGAITSAGPSPGVASEVGEHRRRLAEAHVEGEAAAEPGGVEEAEPGQRLGLVAAQLADEALGRRVTGSVGHVGRGCEQVGGPAAALDDDAAGERRALEAEREAQHLGAGELGRVGPLGQRGRGLCEVGLVELDPACRATHERAGLAWRAGRCRPR